MARITRSSRGAVSPRAASGRVRLNRGWALRAWADGMPEVLALAEVSADAGTLSFRELRFENLTVLEAGSSGGAAIVFRLEPVVLFEGVADLAATIDGGDEAVAFVESADDAIQLTNRSEDVLNEALSVGEQRAVAFATAAALEETVFLDELGGDVFAGGVDAQPEVLSLSEAWSAQSAQRDTPAEGIAMAEASAQTTGSVDSGMEALGFQEARVDHSPVRFGGPIVEVEEDWLGTGYELTEAFALGEALSDALTAASFWVEELHELIPLAGDPFDFMAEPIAITEVTEGTFAAVDARAEAALLAEAGAAPIGYLLPVHEEALGVAEAASDSLAEARSHWVEVLEEFLPLGRYFVEEHAAEQVSLAETLPVSVFGGRALGAEAFVLGEVRQDVLSATRSWVEARTEFLPLGSP